MNGVLEQALLLQVKGKTNKSEELFLQALAEFPDDVDVVSHYSIFLYKLGRYEEALDYFAKAYNHPEQNENTKEDLIEHIWAAYYLPDLERQKANYEANIQSLRNYEHNYLEEFTDFEHLRYCCVPRNLSDFYIFDKEKKAFTSRVGLNIPFTNLEDFIVDDCVLVLNVFETAHLSQIERKTKNTNWADGFRKPMYVLWEDNARTQVFSQIDNYQHLLSLNRLVFFSTENDFIKFREFITDHQAYLPNRLFCDLNLDVYLIKIIEKVMETRTKDIKEKKKVIRKYTCQYDKKYYSDLFSNGNDRIRILFYTCRFTQFVKFATRDFMAACCELGMECMLLVEKTDIHIVTEDELIRVIADFKPNVIFRINFFRSDFTEISEKILFMTWMQDPGLQIFDKEKAKKFFWSDFVLSYSPRWRQTMIDSGYDASRIFVNTVPIDDNIFYQRKISEEEKCRYSADIAFPGNFQNPEKLLIQLLRMCLDDIEDTVKADKIAQLLVELYGVLYSKICNDELIRDEKHCTEIITELAKSSGLIFLDETLESIAGFIFHPICYNLSRRVTLKWLVDAGFDVKIWGEGWNSEFDLSKNVNGIIEHGEELAKMYSANKLVLGNTIIGTTHFRTWEAMACGALSLIRNIPPECDSLDIRESLTENEHFIFYSSREELIEKVKYYLAHEEERKSIVERGREVVLNKMTYKNVAKYYFDCIKENLCNHKRSKKIPKETSAGGV